MNPANIKLRPTSVSVIGSLNRAARINSGLDVINALQAHHGVQVPVLADECESVVDLLPLATQTVRLVVDERYPELHVELEKELVAA